MSYHAWNWSKRLWWYGVAVVWWVVCKPILVFSLAQAKQKLCVALFVYSEAGYQCTYPEHRCTKYDYYWRDSCHLSGDLLFSEQTEWGNFLW